jgi:hypothetical protein
MALGALQVTNADVILGQGSDFEDGSLQNWTPLLENTSNVPGGPGASTRFLQILPASANTRIAAFNNVDYVGSISTDVLAFSIDMRRPLNEPALEMRLVLMGPSDRDRWTSTVFQTVPGDGLWKTYLFSIKEEDLTRVFGTGTYSQLIASLDRLMIRWDDDTPSSRGTSGGTGSLGIDNVLAISEPTGFDVWATEDIPIGNDRTFAGDGDGDGDTNGYEYSVGAEGGISDTDSDRKLSLTPKLNGSNMEVQFGFLLGNAELIWEVGRNDDLGQFNQIYRRENGVETLGADIEAMIDPTDSSKLIVTDKNPVTRAFYQLLITLKINP